MPSHEFRSHSHPPTYNKHRGKKSRSRTVNHSHNNLDAGVRVTIEKLNYPIEFDLATNRGNSTPRTTTLVRNLPTGIIVTSATCSTSRLHRTVTSGNTLTIVPGGPSHTLGRPLSTRLCTRQRLIRYYFSGLGRFQHITAHFRGATHGCLTIIALTTVTL